jgi:hypothetical protein
MTDLRYVVGFEDLFDKISAYRKASDIDREHKKTHKNDDKYSHLAEKSYLGLSVQLICICTLL